MVSPLNELANKEVYKGNPEYVKLFDELDNVCTTEEQDYICESFIDTNFNESFKTKLQQIFNILIRSWEQKDIYINGKSLGNHKSCVYYKYWFYHKIINHNSDEIDIKKLYQVWNQNTNVIYNIIYKEPCKFHAKSLEDVKILKVLYDYALFLNNTEDKCNLLNEIKNCEFCKFLKNYLDSTFKNKKFTCTTSSPYALCMEYNEFLNEFFDFNELLSLSCEYKVEASRSNKCQQLYEKVIEHNKRVAVTDDEHGISTTSFTLFGSLIRRRTGFITNIWKNPQNEKEVLLLRDSETENINFENVQYNIAYNPA
ncbi:PIR Superfamily Protein [Plasmodium ovale curtisi]|uniref:PIR Superfamily Protein n=1 Tax=Plasmodium ovale curtisi TaxID=864141 RepID=A0A1A8VW44_PLAOA|nr:PIR Superfamily Protein [Plasmodium ovale curtisi]SBT00478.1 PIR Superfamily Protein [Plasmodium ovale curtisi]